MRIENFCDFEGYISNYSQNILEAKKTFKADHLLMSFHGLPVRQIKKSDQSRTCLVTANCCDQMTSSNRLCYRAQCYQTARSLAYNLGLENSDYTVCFQSRLGRDEWIRPYTDQVLDGLIAQGVKNLLVVCPAFVADCLETLEEIQMRLKEDFIKKGGHDFKMVLALNDNANWVDSFANLLLERFAQE